MECSSSCVVVHMQLPAWAPGSACHWLPEAATSSLKLLCHPLCLLCKCKKARHSSGGTEAARKLWLSWETVHSPWPRPCLPSLGAGAFHSTLPHSPPSTAGWDLTRTAGHTPSQSGFVDLHRSDPRQEHGTQGPQPCRHSPASCLLLRPPTCICQKP